jgi:hypothetical protein
MQTLKTAVVVVLLIAVCYGAFVALNAPDDDIPGGIREWANGGALGEFGGVEFSGAFEVDTSAAIPVAADWPSGRDASAMPAPPATLPGEPLSANGAHASAGFGSDVRMPDLPGFPMAPVNGNGFSPDSLALPALPGEASLASKAPGGASATPPPAVTSLPDSKTEASPTGPSAGAGTLISAVIGESFESTSTPGGTGAFPGPELPLPDLGGQFNAGLPSLPSSVEQPGVPPTAAPSETSQPSVPDLPFEIARDKALALAKDGELKRALAMLSPYYESPEIGTAEHADLVNILDALSREVVYSKRHLFEAAYAVTAADTLESVARAYQISPGLLRAINDLGDSKAFLANAKLKVVRGPFHARVSLSRKEMTLFLGNLYAGRFPVTIGSDGPPTEGTYNVVDSRTDRTYYGPGGVVIPAGAPDNPYGRHWISLGNELSIHGSPEMSRSDLSNAGCISLAPLDAADAFIILTKDSRVEIRR